MPWTEVTQTNARSVLADTHEKTTFDFKREYDLSVKTTLFEIAKDIAAFANVMGGTVVVGAVEDVQHAPGRVSAFKSVADRAKLTNDVTSALHLCLPRPVVDIEEITLSAPDQLAILGRPATTPVDLLAINVHPLAWGPVGHLVCDAAGGRLADSYRFPTRTVVGTKYLRPEELAFYMNSHERRMLVLFMKIPFDDNNKPFRLWGRKEGGGLVRELRCTPVAIDAEQMTVRIKHLTGSYCPEHDVPLAFVRAIWQAESWWNVAVDGTVFDYPKFNTYLGFIPFGGQSLHA